MAAVKTNLISAAVVILLYFVFASLPSLPLAAWGAQAFYQGVCGGALAFVGYSVTVRALGATQAAVFVALVPPLAIIVSIPLLHSTPSAMQFSAVALATSGVLTNFYPSIRSWLKA